MLNDSAFARRLRVPTAFLSAVLIMLGSTLPSVSARVGQDRSKNVVAVEQQQPSAQQPPAASQPAAQPGQPPQPPQQENSFADLIKDAEVIEGLFTIYRTK